MLSFALAGVIVAACSAASTGTDASEPPDKTAIAFSYASSQYGRGMAVFLMAADRSGLRQIANDSAIDMMPDWSPDGRTLMFTRSRPAEQAGIWVMQADGSGMRQLSGTKGDGNGRWTPDGQSIVFQSYSPGASYLAVMRADGTDRRLIAPELVSDLTGTPTWSKGGVIAFKRSSEDNPGIWIIRSDGSGLTHVTQFIGDAQPRWSPDGTKLVFESFGNAIGAASAIFVINADGTGRRQLTGGADQSAAWSPDGKSILFDRHVPYGYESSCPLYVVPSTGGEAVPLLPERTRASCAGSAWRAVPAR